MDELYIRVKDLLEAAYKTRDFNQGDPPAFQFWAGQCRALSDVLELIRKAKP